MAEAKRDNNQVVTLVGVSNSDGVTPVVLWADPTTHRLLVSISGASSTVYNEILTGTVNGINKEFTLADTPATDTLRLYLEGQRLTPTEDYSLTGDTVTLINAPTLNAPIADYDL